METIAQSPSSPLPGRPYAEACIPGKQRVLGRDLYPLTIGHLLTLEALESPFVGWFERERAEAGDIALVLHLCSRPWVDMRTAAARLSKWRIRWIAAGIANAELAAAQVRTWMVSQYEGPEMVPDPKQPEPNPEDRLGAPEHALLKVALMAELGLSEDDALARPVGAAIWDLAVASERKGGPRIKHPRRLVGRDALVEFALRVQAENIAARAAAGGAS